MSNSEIYTRWNAGMKQVIFETKIDFTKSLDNLKPHINDNFNNINDQLVTIISGYFFKKFYDLVASSLSKVKESIIEALCEENPLPHQKMEK